MPERPEKSPDEYDSWLQDLGSEHPEVLVPGFWEALESNCEQWAKNVSVSSFWEEVERRLDEWTTDFQATKGGALLASHRLPDFLGKGKQRIRSKCYHKGVGRGTKQENVFEGRKTPVPRLNDLVRTRVTCRYVDGVDFFVEKLVALAKEFDVFCDRTYEGRLEGYFAQHFYFTHDVIFKWGGKTRAVEIICEVQVATPLSTMIWKESHGTYEKWRGKGEKQEEWQWNPLDPRYTIRQLGHMIHLADGLLVQLRDEANKSGGET